MKLPEVSMICAMTPRGVIGNNGTMPWHIPRDLKYFAKRTRDSAVVMGPKTLASIGKPLKGRLNIVLTSNRRFNADGVVVAHDERQALELAAIGNYPEFFVIGGAMVYQSFMRMAQQIFITFVWSEMTGDTHFPHWDRSEWKRVWIEKRWRIRQGDEYPSKFAHFRRIPPPLSADRQFSWRREEFLPPT
jgi:dihydrofolate reductase